MRASEKGVHLLIGFEHATQAAVLLLQVRNALGQLHHALLLGLLLLLHAQDTEQSWA